MEEDRLKNASSPANVTIFRFSRLIFMHFEWKKMGKNMSNSRPYRIPFVAC